MSNNNYNNNGAGWLSPFALAIFNVDVSDLWPDQKEEADDIITHAALYADDNNIADWSDWNKRVPDADYIPRLTECVVSYGIGNNVAWVYGNASTVIQTALSRASGRNPAGVAVRL